jgi:glycosyltransferase involved in cell wall biosynthesis
VEQGLPIWRLPRPPHGPLADRYEPYVSHLPLSYLALRGGEYDVAHAVNTPDALVAARWRRRTGLPAILSYMGIPVGEWLAQRRRRELLEAAIDGCDAVIALSQFAAQSFRRELGYPAQVIEAGVDVEAFRPGEQRYRHPTIICPAAVAEPRKNVGLLVEALQLVRRELPKARLLLSRPRSWEAARAAGIALDAPGVEWVDLDDRGRLAAAYGASWVAALAASFEAFGLVLLEALACGTPVAGYDDGGIPEIIDRPEIGVVFRSRDPRPVADALLAALELSQRPDTATRCRERAEELSVDRMTERYIELYRSYGAGATR